VIDYFFWKSGLLTGKFLGLQTLLATATKTLYM